MARVSGIAESLDGRLKATVRATGLDIHALAGRTLVEGILRHWHHGLGPAAIELKGGLLFDQTVRPTSDADLTVARQYLPHELARGMLVIRGLLQAEGMDVDFLSETPQVIDIGHGDPVNQWKLGGKVGGVKTRTQLDLSLARGPDAVSRYGTVRDIPSLIPRLPTLRIRCQPLEAAAAEKLLAVLCQPDTDMRVKHLSDVLDERLWEGVDCGQIARELQRVCRHRGIDPTELPVTLDVSDYERLRENWTKHFRPSAPPLSFDKAIADAAYLWSEVQDCMTPMLRPSLAPVAHEQPARVRGMSR